MKTLRKLKTSDPGFWPKWFGKLFFTLISVKVWGLLAGTIVSTWLLIVHLNNKPIIVGDNIIEFGINGAQWLTFNTTIWALIFGMKEIFRISEQHDYGEHAKLKENLDTKILIAEMMSCQYSDEEDNEELMSGFEQVGNDPDEI
ncbi:hypothetical protein KAR91_88345 [Candidatus Pacearchaeota archaeon]|nr:hypothetical protein [Candidatus Pacearchaeota archaeon]